MVKELVELKITLLNFLICLELYCGSLKKASYMFDAITKLATCSRKNVWCIYSRFGCLVLGSFKIKSGHSLVKICMAAGCSHLYSWVKLLDRGPLWAKMHDRA